MKMLGVSDERTNEELLSAIDATYDRFPDKDLLPGEYRWSADWRGSRLQMLSLSARGLYSELLTQAWADRARLRMVDEDELIRLVRATPEEWALAWPKIRHYFVEAIDPKTGRPVLVNRKQLLVYAGALASRISTIERSRRGGAASAKARKSAPVASPAPKPTERPAAQLVPPCPECAGELQRVERSTSQGGQKYPPKWWCQINKHRITLNDPRVYDKLSSAAKASVDHELAEYERSTAAPPEEPKPLKPKAPRGPSALERSARDAGSPF